MDAINTWTPWAKFIYFPCENLLILSFSLSPPISLVVLILLPSWSTHYQLFAGPFQPPTLASSSLTHIQCILYTAVFFSNWVCPIGPWLCKKPPMVFYNRIKCKHPAWFNKPSWAGPFLPLQPISQHLLSVHVAPKAQISILFCEFTHTMLHSRCFALAVPSAQDIPSTFLPMIGLLSLMSPFTYHLLKKDSPPS